MQIGRQEMLQTAGASAFGGGAGHDQHQIAPEGEADDDQGVAVFFILLIQ